MINIIKSFLNDEQGATAVEYSIMVALIAVVIVVSVIALGLATNAFFSEAAEEFDNF
jgi:pilus assembly protein Flp/PilA